MKEILPHALDKAVSAINPHNNTTSNRLVSNEDQNIENEIAQAIAAQARKILKSQSELKDLNFDAKELLLLSQTNFDAAADSDDSNHQKSLTKAELNNKERNKRKKQKRKEKQKQKKLEVVSQAKESKDTGKEKEPSKDEEDDVIIEYYQERQEIDPLDEEFGHFINLYEKFKLKNDIIVDSKEETKVPEPETANPEYSHLTVKPRGYIFDEDDDQNDKQKSSTAEMTQKQKKRLHRMSCAQLKYLARRPDVVEMHDGNSPDPVILVHLKSMRNSVPVPTHWSYKRRYLSTQREHNKGFFDLPDFIKETGIQEIRDSLQSQEASKSLKAKMRGHVRPKTGKFDIDYQKLHDAFFKNLKKPFMTQMGELYYEGKEFTVKMRKKQPGVLSNELRVALGMPIGPTGHKCPPPWLIAQQRYGPPPSYPGLKIPGLNSPIPDGCTFGYHSGGWGKPPVDEHGKPLYGDVFGVGNDSVNNHPGGNAIEGAKLWGDIISSEEDSEEYDEEAEQKYADEMSASGIVTPSDMQGIVTPSGTYSAQSSASSVISHLDISKATATGRQTAMESAPALYRVIPEKATRVKSDQLVGTGHIYDVSSVLNTGSKNDSASGSHSKKEDQASDREKDQVEQSLLTRSKAAKVHKSNGVDSDEEDEEEISRLKNKKFKF